MLVAAPPTRGLDVGAIETVHSYLRDAAARGVAILLLSEDLDEIRALSDRILVIYEGRDRRRAPGRRRDGRGDRPADGRRRTARDQLERRLTQPLVAVRRRSGGVARRRLRDHGRRPRAHGPRPWETYRRDRRGGVHRERGHVGDSVSATPILFTGLAAAVAFRMQLFNIGAEGQLYLGAVGASWIALQLGDRVRRRRRSMSSRCASPRVSSARRGH